MVEFVEDWDVEPPPEPEGPFAVRCTILDADKNTGWLEVVPGKLGAKDRMAGATVYYKRHEATVFETRAEAIAAIAKCMADPYGSKRYADWEVVPA